MLKFAAPWKEIPVVLSPVARAVTSVMPAVFKVGLMWVTAADNEPALVALRIIFADALASLSVNFSMVVLPADMSPKVCVLLYWERFVSRPAVAVVAPPTLAATWDVNWPVLANCTVPMTPAVPLLLIDAVIPVPAKPLFNWVIT